MKTHLIIFLKGMAMGIAEVIPGVSGGTIAFVTGIYERLLNAIKSIHPRLLKTLQTEGLKGVWQAIDGNFLLALFGGMGVSIVLFVNVITWLMEHHKEMLWAFFFGLIVASTVFIARQLKNWDFKAIALLLFGGGIAFYITIATPANGNEALWFIFITGVIAISAMILPGISGSFIMLLMGMYTIIIPAVSEALKTFATDQLVIVGVFGLGCLVGILTFANVLSWMFKHYHEPTLALLTGFMIGSLNKVWPWRNVLETRINSKGEVVPFLEQSVLPMSYEGSPHIFGVLLLAIVGFLVVLFLEKSSV